jgi:predicted nucleotidyltransferase component of viral defense system
MWDKRTLNQKHIEYNFNKSTLEKVHRLIELLKLFNNDKVLMDQYVLKGGTAINLCLYDFPRLSVDIDMNYNNECPKEVMMSERDKHRKIIQTIASLNKYSISDKSKYSHILDSYVLEYTNLDGNNDNIKLELNYINRVMIHKPIEYNVHSSIFGSLRVLALDKVELYASKIAALIGRTTARDIYDVYNMIHDQQIKTSEIDELRKNTILYLMLSNQFKSIEELQTNFQINIAEVDFKMIKRSLIPMLKIGQKINLEEIKNRILDFINELLNLTQNEKLFVEKFNVGKYQPELLFDNKTAARLKNHPMAEWKMMMFNGNLED